MPNSIKLYIEPEVLPEDLVKEIADLHIQPHVGRFFENMDNWVQKTVYGFFAWFATWEKGKVKQMSDQYLISEGYGEVTFIVQDLRSANPKIAFVLYDRPAVLDPRILSAFWKRILMPDPRTLVANNWLGTDVLELPRGMTKKPFSEGPSEIRYVTINHQQIGNINANTAQFVTSPCVIVCEVTKFPHAADEKEAPAIKKVIWMTLEELAKTPLLCGLSGAALRQVQVWSRNLPPTVENLPWIRLGEKL